MAKEKQRTFKRIPKKLGKRKQRQTYTVCYETRSVKKKPSTKTY